MTLPRFLSRPSVSKTIRRVARFVDRYVYISYFYGAIGPRIRWALEASRMPED